MTKARTKVKPVFTLAVAVALSAHPVVAQQSPTPARSALASVPPHALLRLRLTDGSMVQGRFLSVNDSAVVIHTEGAQSFRLDRAHTVWLRSASSAKRGALTGALVGGAGTAAFFALVFQAFCEVSCEGAALEGAAVGGLIGVVGGGAAGGFIGSFMTHWREYWNRAAGQLFTLNPTRIQVVAARQARWRVEPAVGLGTPLDGTRTSHIPVAGTLTVLRELRPGRGIGFEAGYMDLGGRPKGDPLFNNETNEVRSSMFSIVGRSSITGSSTSPAYWLLGAGVGSHQISNPQATPASQYRETWPIFTIGSGMAWERADVRARALLPVRLPSGGAVLLLLTVGPRF